MSKRRFLLCLSSLLACAGLAACSADSAELHDWVAKQKTLPGEPLKPFPAARTFETFRYAAGDRRDPFSAGANDTKAAGTRDGHAGPERPRQPLESFALEGLKMVGTVGAGAEMDALLADPTGVIHRVRRLEYIGQDNGRISGIDANRIELTELIDDGNGGQMERHASIALGGS